MPKQDNSIIKIVAIVAVVAVAYMFFGNDASQTTQINIPSLPGAAPSQQVQPGTIVVQEAPDTSTHTGNINFKLTSSTGSTGTTSKLLLLDKSEAVFDTGGRFLEQDTRYRIMKILANSGRSGLKGFDGNTPADTSVSSGTWAVSVPGKVGNEYLVFTYVDTSPAKAENGSTAKIIKLDSWQEGTDTWSASIIAGTGGTGNAWSLYNYPYFDWMDQSNSPKAGYNQSNSGASGTTQTITWYANASVEGEKLFDTALFVNAPSNFTGKMARFVVSDKYGNADEFTSMKLASTSDVSIAAGNVPAATLNYNTYYIGTLSDKLVSLRSSTDRNRLTFSMETTTYDTQMNVTVYGVVNAHALRQADSFLFVNPFEIGFNPGITSTYW